MWEAIAEVVESAQPGNQLYIIKHRLDGRSAKAVLDSISKEVEDEVLQIEEELQSGVNGKLLGKNALESRAAKARNLTSKISFYESILQMKLDDLRAQAARAEQDSLSASLASFADGF
jgi:hypothetical protein